MPAHASTTLQFLGRRLASAALATLLAAGACSACSARPITGGSGDRAVSLTSTLDRAAVLAGSEGLVRAEIVLRGRETPDGGRRIVPTDLVVVFDRSGSMQGRKIEDAKAAVRELSSHLGAQDRFALVSYASDARVDVPLSFVTPAARATWLAAIGRMEATSQTNMSEGLDLGIAEVERSREAGRTARVILVSDGLANQGDSSLEGLLARAHRVTRTENVLSAVGVGLDFDEHVMTALADAGTGNFYFIEEASSLAGIFGGEFSAARETVASGAAVTVRPADGVQLVEAAGYPLEWNAGAATLRPGSLFAGQERRIWLTFRAPTGTVGEAPLANVSLSYVEDGRPVSLAAKDLPHVRCVADPARAIASIDKDAWERSVVSEEYRSLQQCVAKAVKEGKRDVALAHIEGYVVLNSALNEAVQSKDVAKNLDDAGKLRAQVGEAFTGTDQAGKQSLMSKQQWAAGQDGRRPGAKKAP